MRQITAAADLHNRALFARSAELICSREVCLEKRYLANVIYLITEHIEPNLGETFTTSFQRTHRFDAAVRLDDYHTAFAAANVFRRILRSKN